MQLHFTVLRQSTCGRDVVWSGRNMVTIAGNAAAGRSKSAPEYRVVRATMADRERLVGFLNATFYKDEPLAVVMGVEEELRDADMDHTLQHLAEGHSLLAVAGERLLGAAINGEVTSDEPSIREKLLAECKNDDFKKFLRFWVHVERNGNCWSNDGPDKALDLEILAVAPEARGCGIGQALINHTRTLARDSGYQLLRMDCSSFFAAQLAEKGGMTCVFAQPYEDYKNEKGEPVFKIPLPHTALKIFMQKL